MNVLCHLQRLASLTIALLPLGAAGQDFAAKTDYGAGNGTYEPAIADVNADGRPDLIAVNYGASTVSVLLGQAAGGFGAKTDYPTGTGPAGVAVVDVNGDSRPDIIAANHTAGTVSVLLAQAGGGFAAKTDYLTGGGCGGISVADVNLDGRLDIITANYNAGTVSVLPGQMGGIFSAKTDYGVNTPGDVEVADVNADGFPDLIAPDVFQSFVAVLLGTGSFSGFGTPTLYPTGSRPGNVAVADLNADGRRDLVTANTGSGANTVSVLLGQATGGFAAKTDYATGVAPQDVVPVDVNGDGRLDLVVANEAANTASVLLGQTAGGFAPKTDYATGAGPLSVKMADVNGDGRIDLVTANFRANSISVLLALPPNRAPTALALSNTSVAENAGANATVGTFTTTDPDAGQTHTYALVSGTGSTDNASFNLSGSTLRLAASADFEVKNSYSIRVRTTDNGTVGGPMSYEQTFTISVINRLEFGGTQTNIACHGASTGAASVTGLAEGTAPYTYDWTPGTPTGDGTASISGLAAGTYQVSVTDANGATGTRSFTITQPAAALTVGSGGQSNSSCGQASGTATAAPSGGTAPYTYSWLNTATSTALTQTTATATGLAAGTYRVTVRDANGCDATRDYTLRNAPVARTQNVTLTLNAAGTATLAPAQVDNGSGDACNPGGSLTLSVSPSSFTCANVGPNTVTLTVTDASGTSSTAPATVTVRDATAPVFTAAACGAGTQADPFTSLGCARGQATGTYWFRSGGHTFQGYVDGTTDGGGWVGILNYVHRGGTNPNLTARTNSLPVQTNAVLGDDESTSVTAWGHAAPSLVGSLNPQELRFFAQTSGIAQAMVIHFKTDHAGTLAYVRTGNGSMSGLQGSFTALPGHTAYLPASADAFFTNQGNAALTEFPFYQAGARHWGIRGLGNRWEVDDFPGNAANHTVHRVFARGAAVTAPGATLVATAAPGQCGANVSWPDLAATDNCGGTPTITYSPASGSLFPVGSTTVTATATDASNNATTTTFTVRVNDPQAPVARTQNVTLTLDATGAATLTAAQVDNNSTDNCGIVSRTLSRTTFTCADVGAVSSAPNQYALAFDGSNDFVNLPAGAFPASGSYTKEAWVRVADAGCRNILSALNGHVLWLTDGKLTAGHGPTYNVVQNPAAFPLNQWVHVAVTYDQPSATLRLYQNGVQVGVSTTAPAYNTTNAMQIGAHGGGCTFNGVMDEVRIWDVARSAADIAASRSQALGGSETSLRAYYNFEHSSGTALTDRTGNGRHGTLANFALTGTASNWVASGVALTAPGVPVTLTVGDVAGNQSAATAYVTVQRPTGVSSVAWTGAAGTNCADCANWGYGTVPTATHDVTIPAGRPNYPSLGNGTALAAKDLTIESGASLTANSGATLAVAGHVSNQGTLTVNVPLTLTGNLSNGGAATLGGTLTLSGGAAQTVGGSGTLSLSGLTVSKTAGTTATLGGDASVSGALALTSGLLNTGSYALTLGSAATLSESATSYVTGTVQTTRPVSTAGVTQTFGGLGLSLTPAAASTALPGSTRVSRVTGTALSGQNNSRSIQRYYDIEPTTNAGLNVTLAFGYRDAELNGLDEATLGFFRSTTGTGGPWQNVPSSARDAAANTVTATGVSHFSVWTLGSSARPLPVELAAFTATPAGDAAVRLTWATASETNSAAFDVERSLDGTRFGRIGTVAAAGNSNAPRAYGLTDAHLPAGAGLLYYRLRQVDRDGTFSYSPVRTVRVAASAFVLVPNPTHAAATLRGAGAGAAVHVFDGVGRVVLAATADAAGTARLPLPAGLPAGVYVVRAGTQATRLVVE